MDMNVLPEVIYSGNRIKARLPLCMNDHNDELRSWNNSYGVVAQTPRCADANTQNRMQVGGLRRLTHVS